MKILIIQQKMIGDVLTTSILFQALREEYPTAKLHYLINTHTYPVVQNNPNIDEFVFFTPEIEKSKLKFWSLIKKVKKEQYDIVIDVYGKLSSLLITYISKAKLRIGFYKPYSLLFYTHALIRKSQSEYNASLAIENRMLLLQPLNVSYEDYRPTIYLKPSERDQAKTYLKNQNINFNKPLFMISVLGSSLAKTYPFEYMAKFLDTIVSNKPNAQILFNYLPKQKKHAKAIFEFCKQKTQSHIFFEVYGNNLREFLAITSHCTALIGNEGGAINMAKALNIRTFTIFSPYLNKQNWFGKIENKYHVAVHLSDYVAYSENDEIIAKKNPEEYYLKLKPEFILPKLESFIANLD